MKEPFLSEYNRVREKGGFRFLDKMVFRVSGDVASLVKGLSTNVLEATRNAFLDRQGKLIVLADQLFVSDQELYLVVSNAYARTLEDHLNMYLPYSKAQLERLSLKVAHVFGDETQPQKLRLPQNAGVLLLLDADRFPEDLVEISPEGYEAFRIEMNRPEQGRDFDQPLFPEINLPEAVSFQKGCYLGQEVVARVHYRGKPKRKLLRIAYEKLPAQVTIQGEKVGEITSKCFSPALDRFLVFAMTERYEEPIDSGTYITQPLGIL